MASSTDLLHQMQHSLIFNENLEKAFDISHNILILGDFNEDLLNQNYHNFRHILTLNSLTNLIKTPTRSNALLDPVLKTDDVLCTDSGVLSVPPGISDHKATFITIPFLLQFKVGRSFVVPQVVGGVLS